MSLSCSHFQLPIFLPYSLSLCSNLHLPFPAPLYSLLSLLCSSRYIPTPLQPTPLPSATSMPTPLFQLSSAFLRSAIRNLTSLLPPRYIYSFSSALYLSAWRCPTENHLLSAAVILSSLNQPLSTISFPNSAPIPSCPLSLQCYTPAP
jgi:hypothetical protein